jgi:hypothetical protein
MKLTGLACTEALSGAEEDERRERAEDNAGGVRLERRVRLGGRQKWNYSYTLIEVPNEPEPTTYTANRSPATHRGGL